MDEQQKIILARAKKKGHNRKWVSTNIPELEMLIGPKATVDLIYYFGGCIIYVPSYRQSAKRVLCEKVCDLFYNQHKTKKEIDHILGWEPFSRTRRSLLNRYLKQGS